MQVSGYGFTPAGSVSNDLLFVNMPIVSNAVCNNALQAAGLGALPVSTFCAGGIAGQSFCTGDSGGPFVLNVGNATNISWVLVGVVRGFGSPTCGSASAYGLFSSVDSQRPFIASAQADTAKSGSPNGVSSLALSTFLLLFLLSFVL